MNIFLNDDEGRLRAGWRIVAQCFLMILIGLAITLLFNSILAWSGRILRTIAMATGAVLSIIAAARGLDRRRWNDYGLQKESQWLLPLSLGFMLAGVAMTLIFFIEYTTGWLTFTGFGWQRINSTPYLLVFGKYFCWMIIVGFYEELLFRGYQITNLAEGLNGSSLSRRQAAISAVVISSVIFGAGHAFNPNASWLSTLNVAIAGAMLAFPFIITGRLTLSVGLHIGWNFFQGGVFGFAVSGISSRAALLQTSQTGPAWITGGSFGPEAGLLGLLGMGFIVACIALYFKITNQPFTMHPRLGIYEPASRYYPT